MNEVFIGLIFLFKKTNSYQTYKTKLSITWDHWLKCQKDWITTEKNQRDDVNSFNFKFWSNYLNEVN